VGGYPFNLGAPFVIGKGSQVVKCDFDGKFGFHNLEKFSPRQGKTSP
jgi:hypothetical protein